MSRGKRHATRTTPPATIERVEELAAIFDDETIRMSDRLAAISELLELSREPIDFSRCFAPRAKATQ
jgi:hypothetical protein